MRWEFYPYKQKGAAVAAPFQSVRCEPLLQDRSGRRRGGELPTVSALGDVECGQ